MFSFEGIASQFNSKISKFQTGPNETEIYGRGLPINDSLAAV